MTGPGIRKCGDPTPLDEAFRNDRLDVLERMLESALNDVEGTYGQRTIDNQRLGGVTVLLNRALLSVREIRGTR